MAHQATKGYHTTLSGCPAYIERHWNSRILPTQNKQKGLMSLWHWISTADILFFTQIHQALMIITALLTVTGVAFAFIYVGHWSEVITTTHSMALSHKNWELPNLQIWLAEIDIDHGLDFLILHWKSSKLKYKNVHHFLLFSSQSFMEVPKSLMTIKKVKGWVNLGRFKLSSSSFAS